MTQPAREWAPVPNFYDPLMAGSIDGTDEDPHDNGVIRAQRAVYKPNKQVSGDPRHTVFIARLDPTTQEDTLTRIFSKFGEVKRLRLVKDIVTGTSKRYAFVEYVDERSAYRAQKEANKTTVDGRMVFVDFELERMLPGWVPRRLGGGLGGNKESGQLRFGGKDRPFKRPIVIAGRMHKTREGGYARGSRDGPGSACDRRAGDRSQTPEQRSSRDATRSHTSAGHNRSSRADGSHGHYQQRAHKSDGAHDGSGTEKRGRLFDRRNSSSYRRDESEDRCSSAASRQRSRSNTRH